MKRWLSRALILTVAIPVFAFAGYYISEYGRLPHATRLDALLVEYKTEPEVRQMLRSWWDRAKRCPIHIHLHAPGATFYETRAEPLVLGVDEEATMRQLEFSGFPGSLSTIGHGGKNYHIIYRRMLFQDPGVKAYLAKYMPKGSYIDMKDTEDLVSSALKIDGCIDLYLAPAKKPAKA